MIKSPYEISCHRRACEATSYAHDKIFSEIKSGMSEHEVSRLAKQYMLQGGADSAGFVIIVSGEENYKRISSIGTDRKFANGDMLWLDLGAQYQG